MKLALNESSEKIIGWLENFSMLHRANAQRSIVTKALPANNGRGLRRLSCTRLIIFHYQQYHTPITGKHVLLCLHNKTVFRFKLLDSLQVITSTCEMFYRYNTQRAMFSLEMEKQRTSERRGHSCS